MRLVAVANEYVTEGKEWGRREGEGNWRYLMRLVQARALLSRRVCDQGSSSGVCERGSVRGPCESVCVCVCVTRSTCV